MQLQISQRIPVTGGFTQADRYRAVLGDGATVFIKQAVDADTAGWLRTEARVYRELAGAPFLARMLDFEDGDQPRLVLEDLGHGYWPGAWRPGDVERVQEALQQVAAVTPPGWLSPVSAEVIRGWNQVAKDPAPFLRLGLCSSRWLSAHLPALVAAEEPWPEPSVFSHCDTRSDNLCLLSDRVIVVDWNWACLAPPGLDQAFWSASLHAEGGPPPEEVVGHSPMWAARVSGFFAARSGLPDLPHAPRVRQIQRVQLETALPWVVRTLGLQPLDL